MARGTAVGNGYLASSGLKGRWNLAAQPEPFAGGSNPVDP